MTEATKCLMEMEAPSLRRSRLQTTRQHQGWTPLTRVSIIVLVAAEAHRLRHHGNLGLGTRPILRAHSPLSQRVYFESVIKEVVARRHSGARGATMDQQK